MEALISLLPEGIFKRICHRCEGVEVLRQTFCLSADAGECRDLAGQLAPDVEASLELELGKYHELPSAVAMTTWRYLKAR